MATRTVYDDRKVNILTEDHVLRNHAALPLPYNQPIQFNLLKKEKLIKITLKQAKI